MTLVLVESKRKWVKKTHTQPPWLVMDICLQVLLLDYRMLALSSLLETKKGC